MSREHDELQALVNDYVDGLLDGDRLRAMEAHLEQCDRCVAEVEATLALQAQARALPRELSPARDLWPEIQSRLRVEERAAARTTVPAVPVLSLDAPRARRMPAWRPWMTRAAAAIALVVGSAGGTALLLQPSGDTVPLAVTPAAVEPAGPAPDRVRPDGSGAVVPVLAAFESGEVEVETLRSAFQRQRGRLAPETVATIERNLGIIDGAIAEARAALESDPSNPDLPLLLSDVYRKKVELLQNAVQLQARS